jgi:Tfp pilus assembly protein PilN
MIEINLIPQKLKKQKQMQLLMMAGAGMVVIIAIVMAGIYVLQIQKNAEVDRKIKMVEAESKSLSDKIDEVKKFNAMEDVYSKKKRVTDSLLYDQSLWPKLLDSIGEMLLPDMWLTKIEQTKEKDEGVVITVSGNTLSKVIVADFIKRLEESKGVMDIKTAKIADVVDPVRNMKVTSFEISYLYKKDKQ